MKKTVKICELEDGRIIVYDLCRDGERSLYCDTHPEEWEYLGKGVTEGILCHIQRKSHFYRQVKD